MFFYDAETVWDIGVQPDGAGQIKLITDIIEGIHHLVCAGVFFLIFDDDITKGTAVFYYFTPDFHVNLPAAHNAGSPGSGESCLNVMSFLRSESDCYFIPSAANLIVVPCLYGKYYMSLTCKSRTTCFILIQVVFG